MSWKSIKGATSAYTCNISIEHKITLECRQVRLADDNKTKMWQITVNGAAIARGKKIIASDVNKEKAKEKAHTWLEEKLTDNLWADLLPVTSRQEQLKQVRRNNNGQSETTVLRYENRGGVRRDGN
mgnify:FL=1